MNLKTIATLDLWKDVKHGDKRTRDARALKAWEQNLGYAQVPFCKVTRWTTVDEHALKWIKESAAQDNKEAQQTGHGYNSEDSDDRQHEWEKDLHERFTDGNERKVRLIFHPACNCIYICLCTSCP